MRRHGYRYTHQQKQWSGGVRGMFGKLSIALAVLLICMVSVLTTFKSSSSPISRSEINVENLWEPAASGGWRSFSAPRSDWPPPPQETNGYLRVRCNGGLNQQRSAVGLILRSMGFNNSTTIYLAAGEIFGGERYMKGFRSMFPHLENHSSVDTTGELARNTRGFACWALLWTT